MSRVVYSRRALDDLLRLTDFLRISDPAAAPGTVDLIIDGVELLQAHPLIGRPTERAHLRELMISRGQTGYIAIYQFDEVHDVVTILAMRHQREAGTPE